MSFHHPGALLRTFSFLFQPLGTSTPSFKRRLCHQLSTFWARPTLGSASLHLNLISQDPEVGRAREVEAQNLPHGWNPLETTNRKKRAPGAQSPFELPYNFPHVSCAGHTSPEHRPTCAINRYMAIQYDTKNPTGQRDLDYIPIPYIDKCVWLVTLTGRSTVRYIQDTYLYVYHTDHKSKISIHTDTASRRARLRAVSYLSIIL